MLGWVLKSPLEHSSQIRGQTMEKAKVRKGLSNLVTRVLGIGEEWIHIRKYGPKKSVSETEPLLVRSSL